MIKYISQQKNLEGKTVLLRADLDAPHANGVVLDDFRIQSSLATIKYVHENGAKVIIISKTGKPKAGDRKETLLPIAVRLGELLGRKVVGVNDRIPNYDVNHLIFFGGDIREKKSQEIIKAADQKDIIILENIRFYSEEQALDHDFAKALASLGDIYVNDAFAMMHRNETSITLLPNLLPSYAGLNVEKELSSLAKLINFKATPFTFVIGGAKISDKVDTIRELGKEADSIIVGGGPANLFFLAKGYEIGKSICEREALNEAQEFLRNFKDKIILPEDVVVATPKDDGSFENVKVVSPTRVSKNEMILDIGPKSILEFSKKIKDASKMLWSGPLGFFENKQFSHGTLTLALIFASRSKGQAFGVAGGGDTLRALHAAKVFDQIDFVSTAGSAMLDFLAGHKLPGIEALSNPNS